MNDTKSLFNGLNLPVEKVGAQRRTEYDYETARIFTIRAIRLKGSITKSKLRILLNNHVAAQYLDEILNEVLAQGTIQDGENKGSITESGDGIKGLLGNGPVTYHWHDSI